MSKTIRSKGQDALCQALIAARKSAGLTQTDLSTRLHRHQSFVARVESGERRIDVVELVVLARALNTDASVIVELVGKVIGADHRV